MRLTATDKAIGELNMQRADIHRAKVYIDGTPAGASTADMIERDLADIDRCVEVLQSVAPAPKPEKAPKVGKPRKSRKGAAEVE